MHAADDTIAAIATPAGEGGVAVVRISGPDACAIADRVFHGRAPVSSLPARKLTFGRVVGGGGTIDRVLAARMPGPQSYTGEDVVELHGHGGILVSRAVLEAVLQAGARTADPGEFTLRAFLTGRIDLTQAEAVADLIGARTERAMRAAEQRLEGGLGREICAAASRVLDLAAEVEARIDFVDDDVGEVDWPELTGRAAAVARELEELEARTRDDQRLRDGVTIVLAGRPNVGKSSLLNALARRDRAIVSEHPGTTRDTVEAEIAIDGIPVRLVDTAGLRDGVHDVERLGIERTTAAVRDADVILLVLDATTTDPPPPLDRPVTATTLLPVYNKIDIKNDSENAPVEGVAAVGCSARTGEGLDQVEAALAERIAGPISRRSGLGGDGWDQGATVGARHVDALRRAREGLERGRRIAGANDPVGVDPVAVDCIAADWRGAWEALGEITGETVGEEILDRIFARFCIGK